MAPLVAMLLTDYKIKARHELLARTIGAKQEEEASLSASNTLVIMATIAMIVVSILEVALYRLYNRKVNSSLHSPINLIAITHLLLLQLHPWEKIRKGEIVIDDVVAEEESCCGDEEAKAETLKTEDENKEDVLLV